MSETHEPGIGDNSDLDIDFDELLQELEEIDDKKTAVSEANGSLRAKIKEVLEQKGYHKGAFSIIRQIEAMSETSRADFLRTFEPMYSAMCDGKWNAERQDLFGE